MTRSRSVLNCGKGTAHRAFRPQKPHHAILAVFCISARFTASATPLTARSFDSSDQLCTGKPEGTACWVELANHPRCHLWRVQELGPWSPCNMEGGVYRWLGGWLGARDGDHYMDGSMSRIRLTANGSFVPVTETHALPSI